MTTIRGIPTEVAGAAAASAGFLALARIAATDEPTPLDRALHRLAVRAYHRGLELLQLPIEVGGLPAVYIPATLLAARRLRRCHVAGVGSIVVAACAGWIALRATRFAYARTRPPRPPHRAPKSESSFPSGHTTGLTSVAVAAAIVLARQGLLSPRSALALGVGIPLVTGLNRVYVREHWLTDVLGGWLLGGAVGLMAAASSYRSYLSS